MTETYYTIFFVVRSLEFCAYENMLCNVTSSIATKSFENIWSSKNVSMYGALSISQSQLLNTLICRKLELSACKTISKSFPVNINVIRRVCYDKRFKTINTVRRVMFVEYAVNVRCGM